MSKVKMTKSQLEEFISNVEIVDEITKLIGQKKIGEPIRVAGIEWIPLEKRPEGLYCISKTSLRRMQFGDNNNLKDSEVLEYLNEKAKEIADIIGEENLIEFETDLTSDDGLDDYGILKSKLSLITCDSYRKNTRTIEKFETDAFFTATPDSTPHRNDSTFVRFVHSFFDLYYWDCGDGCGVRPVALFNPSISES